MLPGGTLEADKGVDAGLLGGLVKVLRPLGEVALRRVVRLHAERKAASDPTSSSTTLLEDSLNETFNRIRGGGVGDIWWRQLLNAAGQDYVAPDWLKEAAVQEWLSSDEVRSGVLAIAKARIMDTQLDEEASIRKRLSQRYLEDIEGTKDSAREAIDVVVAVLAAGYLATIPREQRALVGLVQELHREASRSRRRDDARALARDRIVEDIHSQEAGQALAEILTRRKFDFAQAVRDIRVLWRRVGDADDLGTTADAVKRQIRYWAARLCAVDQETLAYAKELRQEIRSSDTEESLVVLDAWITATGDDADKAIRQLRKVNDPDARTTLLALVVRKRGDAAGVDLFANADPAADSETFTDVGWRVWAVSLAKLGRWDEAARGLRALAANPEWSPVLAAVEGAINGALLIPEEQRLLALDGIPLYLGIAPRFDSNAKEHHARAVACFAFVEDRLSGIADDGLARFIAAWQQWLRLMDPDREQRARAHEEVRSRMSEGTTAVDMMVASWAFGVDFDESVLREWLQQSEKFGGLEDDEVIAECLLNHRTMNPHDFAAYLEGHIDRLDQVLDKSQVASMLFEALLQDGQVERARRVLSLRTAGIDDAMRERMSSAIDAREGKDPRVRLEAAYNKTGSLVDLRNLIGHLRSVGEDSALVPYLRMLFEKDPTFGNAGQLIGFLSRPEISDYRLILDFLDENSLLVEQSDDMRSAKAWAMFYLGDLAEARRVNDVLWAGRHSENDLALDMNIAVARGDWEHLQVIVERGWRRHRELGASVLMMLARHAGRSDRAIALARLAVEKAPDDAHVLTAAYALHFELGRDEEADPSWLRSALAASSSEGPIWQTDLEQMVNEMLPRQREQQGRVERLLMEGQLPMTLAFGMFNMTLSRALLEVPARAVEAGDGRRRVVLPIISGARNPVDVQPDWTVGLDLTAVLVLDHLGLLHRALESFGHVKLPAEMMEALYVEQFAVRFHQPARVQAAKVIRRLVDGGRIHTVGVAETPPELVEEVAPELATLLETCRRDNGVVACVRPIYQARSLMEVEADTSAYDDVIFSPADLCVAVHRRGWIDGDQFERGMNFLASQGQTPSKEMHQSLLDGPVLVDRLALSYLQNAHLIDSIADGRLNLLVHRNVLEEAVALIDAGDSGDDLAERIDKIRIVLRTSIESERVSFLPRTGGSGEEAPERRPSVRSMETLIAGVSSCDAICVDDRYINAHSEASGPSGEPVPVVCVLDVLRYLRTQGAIAEMDYCRAKHRLRQGGFALIPLEGDELLVWLRSADVDKGNLTESAELKALRQSVNWMDSLDLLSPEEATTFVRGILMACMHAIRTLWTEPSTVIERAEALCDWVWRHLVATTFVGKRPLGDAQAGNSRREVLGIRLGVVTLPLVTASTQQRYAYSRWLDRTVFSAFRPANRDFVVEVLEENLSRVRATEEHRQLVGGTFLQGLPESFRGTVIAKNEEFAEECGFEPGMVVNIGENMVVSAPELFRAAECVFAGSESAVVQSRSKEELTVRCGPQSEGNAMLSVEWFNNDGDRRTTEIQELSLLAPDGKVRCEAFERILMRIGPTARIPLDLVADATSRKLSDDEVLLVVGEWGNGINLFRTRLAAKVSLRFGLNVSDFVPPSRTYWERLCGPAPEGMDPESYFREKLVPYRTELLRRELAGGLEICCVGALRDDLLPGQWLEGDDDDTVWEALSSIDVRGNPISLLAALDVALYRIADERFHEFAAAAVRSLLDDDLQLAEGHEIYRLFQVVCDFVMNAMSFGDDMSAQPAYWRRIGAWMQAGLIVHTLVVDRTPVDVAGLEKWCNANMAFGGDVRRLADCRMEPMVMGSQLGAKSLRYEIAVRLLSLKARHEAAGRKVPMAQEIEVALRRMSEEGIGSFVPVPGPCDLHLCPTEPIPVELAEWLESLWEANDATQALDFLAGASQLFTIDGDHVEHSKDAVEGLADSDGPKFEDVLARLYSASVLAAAVRNAELADAIGDVVSRLAGTVSGQHEVEWAIRVLLQAAAAFEDEADWACWLEDRTVGLATNLPAVPNTCLAVFLWYVEGMEPVLPIELWFHVRAKRIATAGADSLDPMERS